MRPFTFSAHRDAQQPQIFRADGPCWRRIPLPGVCTAACLALALAGGGVATPALANTACPTEWSTPDCAAPTAAGDVPALTASFHGLPAKHDGRKLFMLTTVTTVPASDG